MAENFEEFVIAGRIRDPGSIDFELLLPVYFPQFEKWVTVEECLPQEFEIFDGVANDHDQGSRLGTNHTMISKAAREIA